MEGEETKVRKQNLNESKMTIEEELNTLKRKLKAVFNFYTSYGDRLNMSYLKGSKFYRMMFDAGLAGPSKLSMKRIDLLFVKQNHH